MRLPASWRGQTTRTSSRLWMPTLGTCTCSCATMPPPPGLWEFGRFGSARLTRVACSTRSGFSRRRPPGSCIVSCLERTIGSTTSWRRASRCAAARNVRIEAAGSNLAKHLVRAATCGAPPLQFWRSCARDLLHRSQKGLRNSAATAKGGRCSSGRKPAACMHRFQDSEPTRSWQPGSGSLQGGQVD